MARYFEPHYRVAFKCGFGTGLFKGYLTLCFGENVWHDLKPKQDYVLIVYNALLTFLASKLETLWRSMIIKEHNGDKYTIERYGNLMGTDFNLNFEISALLWEQMIEGDRKHILDEFEKHHALIYKCYQELYRGND